MSVYLCSIMILISRVLVDFNVPIAIDLAKAHPEMVIHNANSYGYFSVM